MRNANDFRIKKLNPCAVMPTKASKGAAGFDLYSVEYHLIDPGAWAAVGTGFAMAGPSFAELQIRPRSGLAAKHGVTVLNAPGTVDPDYRGEVKVLLINHGREPFEIQPGDRIAQMVIGGIWSTLAEERPLEIGTFSDTLDETERGVGGFGSTGA